MSVVKRSGEKLRIIVGGLVGQFPLGGVAWDYLSYVLGFDSLGHDVYYHEDTWVWPFDPVLRHTTDSPDFSVSFIRDFFDRYGPQLAHKWHYVLLHERHFGMTEEEFDEVVRTADVFLNVSGVCFFPDKLNPNCLKVFLDTDPGYNQMMLRHRYEWSENVDRWCRFVAEHDRHLTYAENLYGGDCTVPRTAFNWQPTRCVVSLPHWETIRQTPPPSNAPFTTVMTWDWFRGPVVHEGKQYSQKVPEFERFKRLAWESNRRLQVIIAGHAAPRRELWREGWQTIDAHDVTQTAADYQQLIESSFGEWSVAKQVYVATRTGWFSCRTACYLAAGRPAVVQDTGWSNFLPSGRGLFAFETTGEALASLDAAAANPAMQRAAALDVAREYLATDRVLPPMLESIFDPVPHPANPQQRRVPV